MLPLHLWGCSNLSLLVSAVGTPIVTDECTSRKLRVSYARVLVEVDITQKLIEEINIKDKNGNVVTQKVEFEWRPKYCDKCQAVGRNCALKTTRKQWLPKKKPTPEAKDEAEPVANQKRVEVESLNTDTTAELITTPKVHSRQNKEITAEGSWTTINNQGKVKSRINVADVPSVISCANGYEVLEDLNEPLVAFDRGP